MRQRLLCYTSAGPDTSNGTYYDLREPGENAPLHARTTSYLARAVVGDVSALRAPFDLVVPPAWRLMVAASYGDASAAGFDLTANAASGSAFLGQVCAALDARCGDIASRAQLTGRLGAIRSYARVFGLEPSERDDLQDRLKASESPVAALGVLLWFHGRPIDIEALAVRRAEDETLPLDQRVRLVRFALTERGKAGDPHGDLAADAYRIGVRLDQALAHGRDGSLEDALCRSALNRTLAFGPFLNKDRSGTLAHLELAEHLLEGHTPDGLGQELLLADYRFPALETLSTTHRALGDHDLAIDYARRLTALDPYDAKTWFALGKALMGAERAEDAEDAFVRASQCELPHRAKAYYFASIAAQIHGETQRAQHWADCCRQLEPGIDGPSGLAGAPATQHNARSAKPPVPSKPRQRTGTTESRL
ncbi:bacterial transcriptional activator domain-containing protein [Streptomyces sp. NPDC006476]|uniref:bacterial transcriptional activator domain-containing protein n=1 Tax=Streptomyces sp. NPDC006476 TaxID=3157175 RepID=UPI0033AD93D2